MNYYYYYYYWASSHPGSSQGSYQSISYSPSCRLGPFLPFCFAGTVVKPSASAPTVAAGGPTSGVPPSCGPPIAVVGLGSGGRPALLWRPNVVGPPMVIGPVAATWDVGCSRWDTRPRPGPPAPEVETGGRAAVGPPGPTELGVPRARHCPLLCKQTETRPDDNYCTQTHTHTHTMRARKRNFHPAYRQLNPQGSGEGQSIEAGI